MKLTKTLILTLLFCCSALLSSTQNWTALNGPTGGSIRYINMDANGRLYSLTNQGQLFGSSNGGTTWSNLTSAINYLHGFTVDGTTLYANSWQEVYSSTNGGQTWTKRNITNLNALDVGMNKIPGVANGLFVYGSQGAWISLDGGVNWKKVYDNFIYKVSFSSTGDIYAAVPSVGIVKHPVQTTAANWDQSKWVTIRAKAFTSGNDEAITVGVNQNNADKIFISYRNAAGSAMIYETSTNGGTTFAAITPQNPFSTTSDWYSFSGSPSKFYHIVGREIYEVTDGNTPTFARRGDAGNSFYNIRSFHYRGVGEIYAGVEGDGVWKSTDNAASFAPSNGTPPNAIMNIPGRAIEFIGGNFVLIPHSDSKGYWTSTDGSVWTWFALPFTITTARGKTFYRIQDNSILASTNQGTQRTTNGSAWFQRNTEGFQSYLPVGSTEVYGFRDGGVIKKSINQGTTWTPVMVTGYPAAADTYFSAYDGVNIYTVIHQGNNVAQLWKINATTLAASQISVDLAGVNIWEISGMFVFKGKLYIGNRTKIGISSDQGATFKYLNYDHFYLFPIEQKIGGIGISRNGSLVITKDDGITFSSTTLPFRESQITSIVAPNGGAGDTFASVNGSPVLKFAAADSLIRNTSTPYIDFGWTKMDGPYGGGAARRLLKSSSNQLFAESWNAIHRYNATTSKWEQLDNAPVALHSAIHDGSNLYVARWGDLFKSTNGGNTFTNVNTFGQFTEVNGNGSGLFKSSNGTLFVLSDNGLYRSANDGQTFSKILSGKVYVGIAEAGTNLIAVSETSTALTVERSTDNGITWSSAMNGLTITSKKYSNLLRSMESGVVTLTTNDNIYRTTDGGLNWTSIKSNLAAVGATSFCCWNGTYAAPNGDYYFFTGGNPAQLYVSTNQGGSWARRNTGATSSSPLNTVNDALWIGNRLYVLSNDRNGVLFSDDGGATFSILSNNDGFNAFKSFIGGDLKVGNGSISIANESVVSISRNSGATWSSVNNSVGKILTLPNGDIIAYQGQIIKSTDNGATWSLVYNQNYFHHIATSDGTTFFGYTGDRKFQTSTNLTTWTDVSVSGLPASFNLFAFESMAALGNKYYALIFNNSNTRFELYEISGGVATKLSVDNSPNQIVGRDGKLYLLTSESIYESSDGSNWSKRAIPGGANRIIFANNGYLFLTGENGLVWLSRDSGLSWQNVSATNLKARIDDIAIDLSTGIAYGSIASKPLFKSAGIVVPNDRTGPTIGSFVPANGATNISKNGLKLTIVFNEGPKAVAGRNLRIFLASNTATPVETIAVTTGVAIDNRITFTPTFAPNDLGVYYVTIDAGAFTDFYNNPSSALSDVNAWRFTMADATPPTIAFTASNIEKGSPKAFETTITDNGGIANQKITFFHRNITSAAAAPFTSIAMTAQAGGTATNSKFVTSGINESDEMGLEFYIEAEDVAGNKSRSPSIANTYHYAYITYPVANRPSLNDVVTFGGSADTYRIIAIPHKLENASIATVLDELGPADKKNWRLLTYAGSAGGAVNWDEYNGQSGLTNFARGKGYWFNAKTETSLFIEGASSPENNRTSFFKMSLQPGWNQIGNPYPVAINWTEVIAGTNGIGQLKKFAGGAYTNATTLNPLEGGFVFVSGTAQEVTVRFPGITTGGRGAKSAIIRDLGADSWELPLSIEQGELKNSVSGIGMNPKANLNFDSFDDLNMPLFEGLPQAEIQFEKMAGEMKVLAKDIVPTQDEFVWQFNLISNRGEQAFLHWSNDEMGTNAKELYLLDEGTQQLINMREETAYSFNPSQSKSFKIYFGENLKAKIKPGKNHLGKAFPNPASGNVSIPFALSDRAASYVVQLEIYNAQGAKVAVVHEGNLGPGFYIKGWNAEGSNLTNGLYIVRMAVSSVEGQEVKTEKIIIHN